jgi:hypothetical protein
LPHSGAAILCAGGDTVREKGNITLTLSSNIQKLLEENIKIWKKNGDEGTWEEVEKIVL